LRRADVAPAQLAESVVVGILAEALLLHLDDLAVIGRDIARGTKEIGLAQAPARHLDGVVGVAEMRPVEIKGIGTTRHDVPGRERVHLLLHDDAREERQHGDRRPLPPILGHDIEDARIVQHHVLLEGGDTLGHVAAPALVLFRDHDGMPAGIVHDEARFLIGAPEPEDHEPGVQQPRMVRVLDILLHQLPVAGNALARIAQHGQAAAVEDTLVPGCHRRAEIAPQIRHVMIERGEDDAVIDLGLELIEPVFFELEIGGHAALHGATAPDAAPERHGEQIAFQIVEPLVIRADELFDVAVIALAEPRAAMRAMVLDDADLAVLRARQDDRALAEPAALEIAGIGHFGGKPDIAPMMAIEEALELLGVECGIAIDAVRHAAGSALRPFRMPGRSLARIHPGRLRRRTASRDHWSQRRGVCKQRLRQRLGGYRVGLLVPNSAALASPVSTAISTRASAARSSAGSRFCARSWKRCTETPAVTSASTTATTARPPFSRAQKASRLKATATHFFMTRAPPVLLLPAILKPITPGSCDVRH